jgi:beta-carotene/zeaxanthin 4-ketolase
MFLSTAETSVSADRRGLIIGFSLIGGWLLHLNWLLSWNLDSVSPLFLVGAVLLQTLLNTGLFITAHDAIHGLVHPTNLAVNNSIGAFCAIAYAALPYDKLSQNHYLHHRHPRTAEDPDVHFSAQAQHTASFLSWYRIFISQYWSIKQFVQLTTGLLVVVLLFKLSLPKLLLLWALPLLLSSLQLFYFGTYRPHHGPAPSAEHSRCANESRALPWVLSLLACYHFGYHQEHHDHPNVPWWGLPGVYGGKRV